MNKQIKLIESYLFALHAKRTKKGTNEHLVSLRNDFLKATFVQLLLLCQ